MFKMIRSEKMKECYLFVVILAVLVPMVLPASEILSDWGWTRLVSGDRAVWLTRELEIRPEAGEISAPVLSEILVGAGLENQSEERLEAWQRGLQKWGWVQQENEPEHEAYLVIRLVSVTQPEQKIILQKYNIYGKTHESWYDPKGRQLFSKDSQNEPSLDRSVFYTARSPALFVLNQEHFQKQFFEEMLNLDYAGLEAARQAYEQKKILLAAHEVAEYFRRKNHPVWPLATVEKQADLDDAAEKVLRHEFAYHDTTIYLGERIDYRNNPTEDNEWIWGLNRMGHWITLLSGYKHTGNENYAREFNAQVIDWTIRNPAPPFRLTRVPSWRNLEAGVRMMQTWPQSFFGFLSSPSFQTQTVQLMLASMWSHGQHILHFPSGMRFVNNWVIIGSSGLANLGMSFPEFRDAAIWRSNGLQRLSDQLEKQVYPDGMQHELASGYHLACMHSFYQTYEVAEKTGMQVPQNYSRTLEKMFNYIMYISTPSRQVPPTNDANRTDIRGWMKTGAAVFNRPDMLFVGTDGKQGRAPESTSYHFGWGGQSAMRSGWDAQAMYLFFDAGPTGVSHQHEDKLHIGVSAYGRDFLTDGGKGLYIPDKWRNYFVSSRAHNTILIDGQDQNRIPFNKTHRADQVTHRQWLTNSVIDFASGSYQDGYGVQKIPVEQDRYIIFKKNEYWLVVDRLRGNGEHQFDVLYHFTPVQLAVDQEKKTLRTRFADGGNLKLSLNATVPVSLEIIRGAENPEQGWIYADDERKAVPTAVFSGKGNLPLHILTLIEPSGNDEFSMRDAEILTISEAQCHIEVRGKNGVDDWLINLDKENRLEVDGASTDACIIFSRTKNEKIIDKQLFRFQD